MAIRGQGVHDDPYDIEFLLLRLEKEDSIEGFPANGIRLKHIFDTLPVYRIDEKSGWRDMKHSIYFYEDTGILRSVHFFNGRKGKYAFYFKNGNVQKMCIYDLGPTLLNYNVSDQENKYSVSEIQMRMDNEPDKRRFYESLSMAKKFFRQFQYLFEKRST
jgi:hypothetical protein